MREDFKKSLSLTGFPLWEKMRRDGKLISFELEITARCNNNCRHCYINLPADDYEAEAEEMDMRLIRKISDEAVSLGAVWCLVTGGEPLLRKDFPDIYVYLKKKGLLVSVFTNAALIGLKHIKLFKKYPPRDIEVTVYGADKDTYERVTARKGSFDAFKRGVNLLLENDIKVRFKAMALRSNAGELSGIFDFCRTLTKDYFRFDPFLHLRFDGDVNRNKEIKSERLLPEEIVAIEKKDPGRFEMLKKVCEGGKKGNFKRGCLFYCGAGSGSAAVSYNGFLKLCSSLCHPDYMSDLSRNSLKDAWRGIFLKAREAYSERKEFLEKCHICDIMDLCMWCPARAYLEVKKLDKPVKYFCKIAHARALALKK